MPGAPFAPDMPSETPNLDVSTHGPERVMDHFDRPKQKLNHRRRRTSSLAALTGGQQTPPGPSIGLLGQHCATWHAAALEYAVVPAT